MYGLVALHIILDIYNSPYCRVMSGRKDCFWTSLSHVYSSQGSLDDTLISSSELESLLYKATPKLCVRLSDGGLYQPIRLEMNSFVFRNLTNERCECDVGIIRCHCCSSRAIT